MEESLHWADQFAEQITKRREKKEYLVESGITPSGTVHVGNFREILTQDFVYRALLDRGVKARYQYFWDDYDRFRKVPAGVPKEWEEYIGLPVSETPDPWGCHKSYSEHFEAPLVEECKSCGVTPDFVFASKEYKKCVFSEQIKTALEKSEQVKEIINKFRDEARGENWLPVKVYCEKCGKDTTTVTFLGGYEASYKCACGHEAKFDFRKKGIIKLVWRADWPMRWCFYGVDFESAGKEHHASGGSWDTGTLICSEVFGCEPPLGPMYEFVYLKGQQDKMSKSKGNVVTVTDLLGVYEPEVARYLYTQRISQSFNISFDADLLNIYNYYDSAEKAVFGKVEGIDKNEKRRFELAQIKKSRTFQEKPAFSVCANAIQITLGDTSRAMSILKKTGHLEKPTPAVKKRLGLAWSWVNHYAPAEFVFSVQEKMPRVPVDEKTKKVLLCVAAEIENTSSGDDLQKFIYSASNEAGLDLKQTFKTVYQLLLSKDSGPKLGPFLVSLDKNFAAKRLRLEG